MSFPAPADVPFGSGRPPKVLGVGLRAVEPMRWLDLSGDVAVEMAAKEAVLAERRAEVVATVPGSEEAGTELAELVVATVMDDDRWHLAPGGVLTPAATVVDPVAGHGIDAAARLVPDDLCLLDGEDHRLVAASVAAPNRWRLADKIGRRPAEVHAPVPGYDAALAGPVERVLANLRPGRPVERRNWGLLDDPTRFQPVGTPAAAGLTSDEVAGRLWLRIERQGLLRLPRTGAIVFSIRTRQWPLAALADPGAGAAAAGLAAALTELPETLAAYKGVAAYRAPVLAWLRSLPASRPGPGTSQGFPRSTAT